MGHNGHPNSLANLKPRFTPETAKLANKRANEVRWQFHPNRLRAEDQGTPETSPLRRIDSFILRTDNTERINKLLDARAKLIAQERLIKGQTTEQVQAQPPAKPLRFLPKP